MLKYKEIKRDPQRITKIKPFINKNNWEGINYPSEKDDWKKFEKNNVTIALNFLYDRRLHLRQQCLHHLCPSLLNRLAMQID